MMQYTQGTGEWNKTHYIFVLSAYYQRETGAEKNEKRIPRKKYFLVASGK